MLSPDLVVTSNEGSQKIKDQVISKKLVSTDAKTMRGSTETPASIVQEAGKGPKQAKQSLEGVTSKLSFSGVITKSKKGNSCSATNATPAKASSIRSTENLQSNDDTLIDSPSEATLTNKKKAGLSVGSKSVASKDLRDTAQQATSSNSQGKSTLDAKHGTDAEVNSVLDEAKRQLNFNEATMTPVPNATKGIARANETVEGTKSPLRKSPRLRSSAKKKKRKIHPKIWPDQILKER